MQNYEGVVRLSRIQISNFRNFSELDIALSGNLVLVGENRVGKSNLLYALRLIFDASLSDSARQLSISDFWDGLGTPDGDDQITVSVEIEDFEDDLDVLALLTDYGHSRAVKNEQGQADTPPQACRRCDWIFRHGFHF